MANNHYTLANSKLVEEILSKKPYVERFILECPDCFLKRRQQLQLDSIKHSIEIEFVSEVSKRGIKKERKRCLTNMLKAYGYAYSNFQEQLSEDYLLNIGSLIEPNVNKCGYRQGNVMILGSRAIPPGHEKIESEMNNFLFYLNCFDNTIDKAIYSHFHIARIHPFGDGNGRSARLIQNIYLEKDKFLPITIDVNDRKEYLRLISNAAFAHNHKITELKDNGFSDYNAISRSLEKQCITLKELRYLRDVGVKMINENITKDERDFYDFLVLKLRDIFVSEFNDKSKKRLNDCCRKEFRELTKGEK